MDNQSYLPEVRLNILIAGPESMEWRPLAALLDTGATTLQIPRELAIALNIESSCTGSISVELADGSITNLEAGSCKLGIKTSDGEIIVFDSVPVLIGPRGSGVILGMDIIGLFDINLRAGKLTRFVPKEDRLALLRDWKNTLNKLEVRPGEAAKPPKLPRANPIKQPPNYQRGPGAPVMPVPTKKPTKPR